MKRPAWVSPPHKGGGRAEEEGSQWTRPGRQGGARGRVEWGNKRKTTRTSARLARPTRADSFSFSGMSGEGGCLSYKFALFPQSTRRFTCTRLPLMTTRFSAIFTAKGSCSTQPNENQGKVATKYMLNVNDNALHSYSIVLKYRTIRTSKT